MLLQINLHPMRETFGIGEKELEKLADAFDFSVIS